MSLVEPDPVSRYRVTCRALTYLARAKLAVVFPLAFDIMPGAVGLDLRPRIGSEHLLPVDVEAVAVVPHIHHAFLGESLPNGRRHIAIDCPAVGDRGLATFQRRLHAVEPDLHRPIAGVGLL